MLVGAAVPDHRDREAGHHHGHDRELGGDQGVLEGATPPSRSISSRAFGESSRSPMLGAIEPRTTPSTAMATVHVAPSGVQPQAQRHCVGEARRPGRGTGSGCEHPGAEVAVRAERLGDSDERGGGGDVQQQHPPPGPRPRPQLRRPAERREPAQPRHRGVPHGPQQEQHAQCPPRRWRHRCAQLAESWHATAVSPVATSPMPAHEAPKASEPATGKPAGDVASAASRPTTTATSAPSVTAAARVASRPIAVPPSSSAWPDSSSVRVCRVRRRAASAPRRPRRAPSSWSSRARPRSARRGSARRARPPTGSR